MSGLTLCNALASLQRCLLDNGDKVWFLNIYLDTALAVRYFTTQTESIKIKENKKPSNGYQKV